MTQIILGSQSPRRRELLKGAGFDFEIFSFKLLHDAYTNATEWFQKEHVTPYIHHNTYVRRGFEKKGDLVYEKFGSDKIIITADTVVILENEIIGKPTDFKDAKQILQKLSGKMHEVVTGVCMQFNGKKMVFSDTTKVYFEALSQKEIDYFVDNYKPLDKAGAYAIQEWIGYIGVRRIEGCFFNVMGLPIPLVYKKLKEWSEV